MSVSHNNLGMIALLQHDYGRAATHIGESMRLAQAVGDLWIVAVGQHNDGIARRGLAEYAKSGEAFAAALQAYLDRNDRWSLTLLVEDVAFLAMDTGQERDALRLLGAADARPLEALRPPVTGARWWSCSRRRSPRRDRDWVRTLRSPSRRARYRPLGTFLNWFVRCVGICALSDRTNDG